VPDASAVCHQCGGGKADKVQSGLLRGQAQFRVLSGGRSSHDQPVNAAAFCAGQEGRYAMNKLGDCT